MRILTVSAFLALCTLGLLAEEGHAPATVHSAYIKGEKFLEFSDSRQRAYVLGLVDGFFFAPVPVTQGTLPRIEACVERMNDVQLAKILGTFVREHRDRWHESSHQLLYAALLEACPAPG